MKDLNWLTSTPWADMPVHIIGGGSSLKKFDWSTLEDRLVIGCNDAYKHGHKICDICFFGDINWWREHKERLEKYEGTVVTRRIGTMKSFILKLCCLNRINFFKSSGQV